MYLELDIGYYEVMQILDLETRSSQNEIDVITLFQTSLFCPKLFEPNLTKDFEFQKAQKLNDLLGLLGLCQKIMKGLSFRGQKLLSDLDFKGTEKISDPTSEVIRGPQNPF